MNKATLYIAVNYTVCVCVFDRQGSSVEKPSSGSKWANCDAHPAATVPRPVCLPPPGYHTGASGTARHLQVCLGVKHRGNAKTNT